MPYPSISQRHKKDFVSESDMKSGNPFFPQQCTLSFYTPTQRDVEGGSACPQSTKAEGIATTEAAGPSSLQFALIIPVSVDGCSPFPHLLSRDRT